MEERPQNPEREKAREQLREAILRSGLSKAAFSDHKGIPFSTLKRWLTHGPPDPILDWIRITSPE